MAFMMAIGSCVGCKRVFSFNPEVVPSLVVNGSREPLCFSCTMEWARIHGQPVTIHPEAYNLQEI